MTDNIEPRVQNVETLIDRDLANGDEHVIKFTEACLRRDALVPSPAYGAAVDRVLCTMRRADQLCGIVGCHPTELSTPQNNRARAAAFSRRWRSRSQRYSSNAARSAAVTEAWVGTTHAVGQRVTPFVRMYSSMTVSQAASEIISIAVSLRTEEITGNASRLPDGDISSLQPS